MKPGRVNIVFLFFAVFPFFIKSAEAQSYGLRFASHEVVQDKRTFLDLTPERAVCIKDNFELSFDLSFVPNLQTYFGYILRIVSDSGDNVDFVYDGQALQNRFNLIVGEKLTRIVFDIDKSRLYSQWNRVKLRFDFDRHRLILATGSKTYTEHVPGLKPGCYRMLFGANQFRQYATTDVPPMIVKDVTLAEDNSKKYEWLLNEEKGQIAHETINQANGKVSNPSWVAAMHHKWTLATEAVAKGPASVAFDSEREILYVIGTDSLYTYSVAANSWVNKTHGSLPPFLNIGSQAAFNPFDGRLYSILREQQTVPYFDLSKQGWNRRSSEATLTDYWQANKMFVKRNHSIYLFGGYGHLRYYNDVQRYQIDSGKWERIKPKGDFFMPRYLAALGATASGDTAYILGGYGNASGKQILGPKNIYDLMRYTVKDNSFKKLFELNVKDENFAFANSLVIDQTSHSYYALIFPEHNYNSTLQLIKGTLNKPGYTILGDPIPYSFHDIHSFADLYYCPVSKRLVAVTLLRSQDNRSTAVRVFTLLSPPYPSHKEKITEKRGAKWYILGGIVLLLSLVIYILGTRKEKRTITPDRTPLATEPPLSNNISAIQPHMAVNPGNNVQQFVTDTNGQEEQIRNAIFLFGDLQIYDSAGCDITKGFTPLIKELFLVILLYSVKWGRGLSSDKLTEILWYDKSVKSARNNRSVNIAKLKSLLEKIPHCQLSKDTGYWKIDIDYEQVYVDYYYYLKIIKDRKAISLEAIKALSSIVRRGNFLSNLEYEWLDAFKSEISNEVIDNFSHFIHQQHENQDPELLIEIANLIFYFDPVNEEAMMIKCKALSTLGKHSLARHTFENFSKEYKVLYGEDFKKDFHTISE